MWLRGGASGRCIGLVGLVCSLAVGAELEEETEKKKEKKKETECSSALQVALKCPSFWVWHVFALFPQTFSRPLGSAPPIRPGPS